MYTLYRGYIQLYILVLAVVSSSVVFLKSVGSRAIPERFHLKILIVCIMTLCKFLRWSYSRETTSFDKVFGVECCHLLAWLLRLSWFALCHFWIFRRSPSYPSNLLCLLASLPQLFSSAPWLGCVSWISWVPSFFVFCTGQGSFLAHCRISQGPLFVKTKCRHSVLALWLCSFLRAWGKPALPKCQAGGDGQLGQVIHRSSVVKKGDIDPRKTQTPWMSRYIIRLFWLAWSVVVWCFHFHLGMHNQYTRIYS